MTVNQMLKRTRLGHTPLGLMVPGSVCQAVLPQKEEQAPRRSAAVSGVSREETASLKDSKWRYRGTAQEEGFGGEKNAGVVGCCRYKSLLLLVSTPKRDGQQAASIQTHSKHSVPGKRLICQPWMPYSTGECQNPSYVLWSWYLCGSSSPSLPVLCEGSFNRTGSCAMERVSQSIGLSVSSSDWECCPCLHVCGSSTSRGVGGLAGRNLRGQPLDVRARSGSHLQRLQG